MEVWMRYVHGRSDRMVVVQTLCRHLGNSFESKELSRFGDRCDSNINFSGEKTKAGDAEDRRQVIFSACIYKRGIGEAVTAVTFGLQLYSPKEKDRVTGTEFRCHPIVSFVTVRYHRGQGAKGVKIPTALKTYTGQTVTREKKRNQTWVYTHNAKEENNG